MQKNPCSNFYAFEIVWERSIIWLLPLFYQLQHAKWSLRKYPIACWAVSQEQEFNSRTHMSLLLTKECYSGKGGAVAFLSWKDITEPPNGAPAHRLWVWVGPGGFLSLLLALGHGWDRQGLEKVKEFLSAAWLLLLRFQSWSGSSRLPFIQQLRKARHKSMEQDWDVLQWPGARVSDWCWNPAEQVTPRAKHSSEESYAPLIKKTLKNHRTHATPWPCSWKSWKSLCNENSEIAEL